MMVWGTIRRITTGREPVPGFMKNGNRLRKLIFIPLLFAISAAAAVGQETKKYANGGVTFEYLPAWELTEQSAADSQQISLSNKETDSQILVIVLRKQVNSKEPMADLKKQVVDPWLTQLISQYKTGGISVVREASTGEISGQQAEGMKLRFFWMTILAVPRPIGCCSANA